MARIGGKKNVCVGGSWGNLKDRDGLGRPKCRVEGNIHRKQREFWTGFIWLRAGTLSGPL